MKYAQTRNIYGKCKRSRKTASTLLWSDVNYYSNDAAEALTSRAPDGLTAVHASSIHAHTLQQLLQQPKHGAPTTPAPPPPASRLSSSSALILLLHTPANFTIVVIASLATLLYLILATVPSLDISYDMWLSGDIVKPCRTPITFSCCCTQVTSCSLLKNAYLVTDMPLNILLNSLRRMLFRESDPVRYSHVFSCGMISLFRKSSLTIGCTEPKNTGQECMVA
jgi:hypothetical protein